MGDFFKSRRRIVGVLALMIACGFMSVWLVTNRISVHFATAYIDPVQFLTAKHGYLRWASYPGSTISEPVSLRFGRLDDPELDSIDAEGMQKDLVWKWHWAWGGFEFGNGLSQHVRIWAVPFWFIITLLALISLMLLCSKPRLSKPKNDLQKLAIDQKHKSR